jgi:Na+-transporting methylmalonyl-CoA/oxaloacetate decarboxylase gamma subunit
MKWNEFFLWISFMILIFVLLHLFIWIIWFSSKVEARWSVAGEIVPVSAEAPPPNRAPLSKKR